MKKAEILLALILVMGIILCSCNSVNISDSSNTTISTISTMAEVSEKTDNQTKNADVTTNRYGVKFNIKNGFPTDDSENTITNLSCPCFFILSDDEDYAKLAKNQKTSGDYIYSLFNDGVCINKYIGKSSDVVIPDYIAGKKVLKIGCYYTADGDSEAPFYSNYGIKSIFLSKYVHYIVASAFNVQSTVFTKIDSDNDNEYYTCDKGVLYSKNKEVLLYLPDNYGGNFKIPDSVKEIGYFAINHNVNVKSIELGAAVDTATADMPSNLESIAVKSSNKTFAAINGVLYNKNITEIVAYPNAKKDEEFVLPDSVKVIDKYNFAFNGVRNLKTLSVGKNIQKLDMFIDKGEEADGVAVAGTSLTTIKGYRGTAAETFAKDNNLKFAALD